MGCAESHAGVPVEKVEEEEGVGGGATALPAVSGSFLTTTVEKEEEEEADIAEAAQFFRHLMPMTLGFSVTTSWNVFMTENHSMTWATQVAVYKSFKKWLTTRFMLAFKVSRNNIAVSHERVFHGGVPGAVPGMNYEGGDVLYMQWKPEKITDLTVMQGNFYSCSPSSPDFLPWRQLSEIVVELLAGASGVKCVAFICCLNVYKEDELKLFFRSVVEKLPPSVIVLDLRFAGISSLMERTFLSWLEEHTRGRCNILSNVDIIPVHFV